MIRSFVDVGTRHVFDAEDSRQARRTCPVGLWTIARSKLDHINRAQDLIDLAAPPRNRLEPLRHDRSGQHSIRINDQYRVCFRWENGHAFEVEITDYH